MLLSFKSLKICQAKCKFLYKQLQQDFNCEKQKLLQQLQQKPYNRPSNEPTMTVIILVTKQNNKTNKKKSYTRYHQQEKYSYITTTKTAAIITMTLHQCHSILSLKKKNTTAYIQEQPTNNQLKTTMKMDEQRRMTEKNTTKTKQDDFKNKTLEKNQLKKNT